MNRFSALPKGILLTLCLGSLFSVFYYQSAWGWPMIDGFPQIERILDPTFLPNDFYSNTFSAFNARYYFSLWIVWMSRFLGVDYPVLIGYLNLIRIFVLHLMVYLLAKSITRNAYAALTAAFIGSISLYVIPQTVGWGFTGVDFNSGNAALVLVVAGMSMVVRGHVSRAFALFALGMILHPVVTIHGVMISALYYVSLKGKNTWSSMMTFKRISSLLLMTASFLVSYIPYQRSLKGEPELSSERFLYIIGTIRHPHHYIPSSFGGKEWLIFFFLIGTFAYMVWALRETWERKHTLFFTLYLLFIACMMLIGLVLVEWVPNKMVITLIPYRTLVFFVPLYFVLFGAFLQRLWKKGQYFWFTGFHLPFFIVLGSTAEKGSIGLILLFVFYILTRQLPLKPRLFLDDDWQTRIYVILLMGLFFYGWSVGKTFEMNIPDVKNPAYQLYDHIHTHTEADAVIWAEERVDALVSQKIRLLSRRAVAVSVDFPFNERHYESWYTRFKDLYGGEYEGRKGFVDRLDEKTLYQLSLQYEVDYVLRNAPIAHSTLFTEQIITLDQRVVYLYKRNKQR